MVGQAAHAHVFDVDVSRQERLEALAQSCGFDHTFLHTLRAEIGGRSFDRLVNTCIDDIVTRLELLATETADRSSTRAVAHQLLGIFGHIGATGGADAARRVLENDAEHFRAGVTELQSMGQASVLVLQSIGVALE